MDRRSAASGDPCSRSSRGSTGHNEFIDQRVYAHLFDRPRWLFALQQRLMHLRLYVPVFGANLRSDSWEDEHERDPEAQRFFALAMFRKNVDRMIRIGQATREHFRLAHNLTLGNFGTTPARNEVLRQPAGGRRARGVLVLA